MNTDTMIDSFIRTHKDRYDYTKSVYTNAKTPVVIVCRIHGEFSQRISRHKSGSNCPICVREESRDNINSFIKKAKLKHGDTYDYSQVIYKNSITKVSIVCKEHGVFEQTPASHLSGRGCSNCYTPRGRTRKEHDAFISECIAVHGNTYDYSNVEYISHDNPISIICLSHGEFTQMPPVHLRGSGCPKCSTDKKTLTSDDFIKRSSIIHNNKYDYTNIPTGVVPTCVEILCPVHGIFKQNKITHINGGGCPKCGQQRDKNSQDSVITRAIEKHGSVYDYTKVEYTGYHNNITILCNNHGEFKQTPANHIAGNGCPKCVSKVSKPEIELLEFVRSLGVDAYRSRGIISPKEIDVYIPSHNLGIEFNGIFWHSSASVDTDKYFEKKHIEKTIECESVGVSLLHIFENEWMCNTKREIWKSVIRTKLGMNHKIFARKCNMVNVDKHTANEFCDKNHLQGSCSHSYAVGMEYNNELVMIATFGKPRYDKSASVELIRMCSILNTTVVGGASRLLKDKHNLVSYANRRWSCGNVYDTIGFVEKSRSKPSYYYTKRTDIHHRSSFMKHKLKSKLEIFDESLSERENMYKNGYRRIWDCGTIVYHKS